MVDWYLPFMKSKRDKRIRRHSRIRAKISGTSERPRLSVFRSNSHMYAQLVDDARGITVVSASSASVKAKNKTAAAKLVGKTLAEKALGKKVAKVVFDRGGYVYTGRVRALAEGAREGGLAF